MTMGPGAALTGELLWDYSQVKPKDGHKIMVKLSTVLSLSEHLVIKGNDQMEKDEKVADRELDLIR